MSVRSFRSFRIKEFENPPASHRSIPLWSWNDKLEEREIRSQIREMKKAGQGGFIMHARSGLRTPYMGEEWMNSVAIAVEEASRQGLEAWCYDENGWPSGTANGIVPAKGRAFQQKWLEYEWVEPFEGFQTEDLLVVLKKYGNKWQVIRGDDLQERVLAIYVRVNPYYVDVLQPKVMEAFLEACHEQYSERFGNEFGKTIPGIFSDEFKFKSVPWSDTLEEQYLLRYGRELLLDLPYVLGCGDAGEDVEDSYRARFRFWNLISELFCEAVRLVGDWCRNHDWKLTGHIMGEDNLQSQMQFTAGVMPLYDAMDMPGIDLLGRTNRSVLLPKQVSSVARQLGKPFVLSETFGCGGWDLTFDEMKRIGEWQFVLGVNRLCPHLQGYSMQGIRKRDYPPSIYVQQPWWEEYGKFELYFARLSYLLTLGEAGRDVLVLHPIQSAWLLYETGREGAVEDLSAKLSALLEQLLSGQRDFDLGDETLLGAHGEVVNGLLKVGACSYRTVILPYMIGVRESTARLLREFVDAGGLVIVCGDSPVYCAGVKDDARLGALVSDARVVHVADAGEPLGWVSPTVRVKGTGAKGVYVQKRVWEGAELYYCVNTSESESASVVLEFCDAGSEIYELDVLHGEVCRTRLEATIGAGQSRVFLCGKVDAGVVVESDFGVAGSCDFTLALGGSWHAQPLHSNAITLDYARYRIGDMEWASPAYVLKIQELCILRREPVTVELEYSFYVDSSWTEWNAQLDKWQLAMEDRENWRVWVNGNELPSTASGTFRDHAIRTYGIGPFLRSGTNLVRMSRHFICNEGVYRFYGNAEANLAPIRNKLTYDTEIESIYILGPFAVQADKGAFSLVKPEAKVQLEDITSHGYWFYSGAWQLTRDIQMEADIVGALRSGLKRAILRWDKMRIPVCSISIQGGSPHSFLWGPYELDITGEVTSATNGRLTLQLQLTTSCRNLFGPHHHLKGEVKFVGPTSFTDLIGWVDQGATEIWTDAYTFVTYGIDGLRIDIVESEGEE